MPRRKKSDGLNQALIWIPIVLLVLIVGAFFALRIWFDNFLHSEKFRRIVSGATSAAIQAQGEYEPFRFEGTTIYSDGFRASRGGFFSELRADQLRAQFNLRGIFDRAWQIDELEVQRLAVDLEKKPAVEKEAREKIGAVSADEIENRKSKAGRGGAIENSSWLPNRLDLRRAFVRDTSLKWLQNETARGSVEGAALAITPENGAWQIDVEGGKARQAGWPDLEVRRARLRYKQPTLFITESEFKLPGSGTIAASGEVNFPNESRNHSTLDIQLKLNAISVEPLLTPDWRARLHGNLSGDVRIQSGQNNSAAPLVSGNVRLSDGQLVALPVLDQIALFTNTLQFRRLSLTRAAAEFTQAGPLLTVQKFLLESEGLIRVEGAFTVANGNIDGAFQVGVTPTSLQWLPGSQDKVFTNAHDGYVWTPVRVTGPLANPNDDLRARLAVAAGQTVIETGANKVQEVVKDPAKALEKTVKEGLDLLSPLLK